MNIPKSHPRYESLIIRERLVEGLKKGIVHETGLIAHGRGEAFDYIIGERTIDLAEVAERASSALLLLAKKPVISVNGNTAVLVADKIVKLAEKCNADIEVNLFHRSEERIRKIISLLKENGAKNVLGMEGDARIDGLEHDRAICSKKGIYSADVVLVPLEDGDRCEALKRMGKKVITVDLNPLSRTARKADITIVDNVTRAIPNIIKWIEVLKNKDKDILRDMVESWDNKKMLKQILIYISKRLNSI